MAQLESRKHSMVNGQQQPQALKTFSTDTYYICGGEFLDNPALNATLTTELKTKET